MTNIVILVGNLGADPQSRTTSGGTDVSTFNLGTSRVKRDSEGKTYKDESGFTAKDTEWHRVTVWGKLAEICGKLFHGLVVAQSAGELCKKREIHTGSHVVGALGHLGQAALLSPPPPGFIISCSTASIDGRS